MNETMESGKSKETNNFYFLCFFFFFKIMLLALTAGRF